MIDDCIAVRPYTPEDGEAVTRLVAAFRVALLALTGRAVEPDLPAAAGELRDYLDKRYPLFVATAGDGPCPIGYLVCRIDGETAWAESLYVSPEHRRRGVAGRLYDAAEQIARALGQDTLYNWVHPHNDAIILFLKERGYDALNLVEVRRRYGGEEIRGTLRVGDHEFAFG